MSDADDVRVFAGDCTTTFEGPRERTQRGYVVVVVKPDKTVLVHDADGYQPVAWLTRPDSLTIETGTDGGFSLTARTADQTLRVVSHRPTGRVDFPVGEAGVPVGECPDCARSESRSGGPLVRTGGDVLCLECGARYGLPAGATVLDDTCEACGLPRMRVERGDVFDLCVDVGCESLADAVRERFDREWECPDCGRNLRVRRYDGRLFLGCDGYPDCETAFSLPAGVVVGTCDCGLPVFEMATGRRCLDGTCDRYHGGTDA